MIAIINIGGDKLGISKYRVQINEDIICEFEHNRVDGLGTCLLEASKAVERAKWEESKRLLDLLGKEDGDG